MSALRFILRDFRVYWTRSNLLSTVVKRCKRDRSVREVIQCFKHTFLRPRRTLLLSATAACKAREEDDDETSASCDKNITDEELQDLMSELDGVETLSKCTLFCNRCEKRLVIEKKQPGVPYCSCKVADIPAESPDGWVPYMEAEDVIIWRKEYKPGLGLYAYKVYGRYSEVRASDFAAVQLDGAYRLEWDAAVAALSVVERPANGLADQAVLHWEVLWPRLFANRDYVYIRRHKEFDVAAENLPLKDALFRPTPSREERFCVHTKAKRKAMETNESETDSISSDNKVYVIVSRSCDHPKVPETKHAIRVSEYWSHMVVKTLNGPHKSGMEFVLTYYDEPAVGGMPSTVAAWATGRAAPAYLQRMRRAASDYKQWRLVRSQQDLPEEDVPFVSDSEPSKPGAVNEEDMEDASNDPVNVDVIDLYKTMWMPNPILVRRDLFKTFITNQTFMSVPAPRYFFELRTKNGPATFLTLHNINSYAAEENRKESKRILSSQSGPDIEGESTRDQSTQTEVTVNPTQPPEVKVTVLLDKAVETEVKDVKDESQNVSSDIETDKTDEEGTKNG